MNKMFIINEYAFGRITSPELESAPEEVQQFVHCLEAEERNAEVERLLREWVEGNFLYFNETRAPGLLEAAARVRMGSHEDVLRARDILWFLQKLDNGVPPALPYGRRSDSGFWSEISKGVRRRLAEGNLTNVEEIIRWWVKNHPSAEFANGGITETFGDFTEGLSDEAVRFLAACCGTHTSFWREAMRRRLSVWAPTEAMRAEVEREERLRADEAVIPGLRWIIKMPTRDLCLKVASWWREKEPRPSVDTVVEIVMRYISTPLTRKGKWGDDEDCTEEFLRASLQQQES